MKLLAEWERVSASRWDPTMSRQLSRDNLNAVSGHLTGLAKRPVTLGDAPLSLENSSEIMQPPLWNPFRTEMERTKSEGLERVTPAISDAFDIREHT